MDPPLVILPTGILCYVSHKIFSFRIWKIRLRVLNARFSSFSHWRCRCCCCCCCRYSSVRLDLFSSNCVRFVCTATHTFQVVAAESVFTTVATGRFVFGCMSPRALQMRKISFVFRRQLFWWIIGDFFQFSAIFPENHNFFDFFQIFYNLNTDNTFSSGRRINVELFGKSMTISVARSQFISTHQTNDVDKRNGTQNTQEPTKKNQPNLS